MATVPEIMQVWGQRFLGVTADTEVRFSDDSMSQGGCDTCGYGGDTGYQLEVATLWDPKNIDGYRSKHYERGFTDLLEELEDIRKELEAR